MRTLESINLEIAVAEKKRDEIQNELNLQQKYLIELYAERFKDKSSMRIGEHYRNGNEVIEITGVEATKWGTCNFLFKTFKKDGSLGIRESRVYSFHTLSKITLEGVDAQ